MTCIYIKKAKLNHWNRATLCGTQTSRHTGTTWGTISITCELLFSENKCVLKCSSHDDPTILFCGEKESCERIALICALSSNYLDQFIFAIFFRLNITAKNYDESSYASLRVRAFANRKKLRGKKFSFSFVAVTPEFVRTSTLVPRAAHWGHTGGSAPDGRCVRSAARRRCRRSALRRRSLRHRGGSFWVCRSNDPRSENNTHFYFRTLNDQKHPVSLLYENDHTAGAFDFFPSLEFWREKWPLAWWIVKYCKH